LKCREDAYEQFNQKDKTNFSKYPYPNFPVQVSVEIIMPESNNSHNPNFHFSTDINNTTATGWKMKLTINEDGYPNQPKIETIP